MLYALGNNISANINVKDATQIADPLTDPPVRETWDVSVLATDPHASEVRQNSGEFTIVRNGLSDLSKPLTVWFEITGLAAHTGDYTG